MTQQSRTPEILETLVLNIREAAQTARALVGAQTCQLHLTAEMDWARARLTGAGLVLAAKTLLPEDLGPPNSIAPGVRKLPLPVGSPTDLLDIGVDITGSPTTAVAMLHLEKVQAGWATRENLAGLDNLMSLLNRQFLALEHGPKIVAEPMLRLVTLLRDLDDQAVSHSLSGLLRVLAGQQPSRVEVMAMRICGLADSLQPCLEDRDVALSDVTQVLLDRSGIGRTARPVEFSPYAGGWSAEPAIAPPASVVPFARVRIVEQDFDVAEAENSDRLWFRAQGEVEGWIPLANGSADGWTAIAAEILSQTRDITNEYAQMHLIRRRDIRTEEVAEAYELGGVIWWLRAGERGSEARLDGCDWQDCTTEPGLSVKARALKALLQLDADIVSGLSEQARDWAHRMAHSVQVAPYIGIAAE